MSFVFFLFFTGEDRSLPYQVVAELTITDDIVGELGFSVDATGELSYQDEVVGDLNIL